MASGHHSLLIILLIMTQSKKNMLVPVKKKLIKLLSVDFNFFRQTDDPPIATRAYHAVF